MTRDAAQVHAGDHIHVTPHDVYGNHIGRDQWVTLTADPIEHGDVVVLAGQADDGAWTATTYGAHQPIELDGAA